MSATVATGLRIGEVARRVGTTPRTIRYYEEIGLLEAGDDREAGRHRLYGEREVERLRDALRLKELLGVSLDELKALLEAQEARAALRDEWHRGAPDAARRREMVEESLGHIDRQLALVRRRRDEIAALEGELAAKRRKVQRRLRALAGD
ncbi:MAG: MerR family transcriptional regulator, repressor of the yfmOP operon [Solirubrobacteraceae bacterium]|jgi:DNA-binding transcriptional MerR regulator|nr:MerR family transcriptional regulator, repressor of the yfmOP operon [Solirubrobacteraceae bacterium]